MQSFMKQPNTKVASTTLIQNVRVTNINFGINNFFWLDVNHINVTFNNCYFENASKI